MNACDDSMALIVGARTSVGAVGRIVKDVTEEIKDMQNPAAEARKLLPMMLFGYGIKFGVSWI